MRFVTRRSEIKQPVPIVTEPQEGMLLVNISSSTRRLYFHDLLGGQRSNKPLLLTPNGG